MSGLERVLAALLAFWAVGAAGAPPPANGFARTIAALMLPASVQVQSGSHWRKIESAKSIRWGRRQPQMAHEVLRPVSPVMRIARLRGSSGVLSISQGMRVHSFPIQLPEPPFPSYNCSSSPRAGFRTLAMYCVRGLMFNSASSMP